MYDFYNFLFYEKSAGIVEKIDEAKFIGLNLPETSRLDLYLFAMSLGKGCGTPLSKKDSFIRSEYLKSKLEALPLITSLSLGECTDDNLDPFLDKSRMYNNADECANTGFRIIQDWIENKSSENLELRLTADLDEIYKALDLF